ncbi:hypothetical protein AMTRI_Chr05g71620 [Amborella trichopoda]
MWMSEQCALSKTMETRLNSFAFSKIQENIISSFQYLTSRKDKETYEVTHFSKKEKGRKDSLVVENSVMNCRCKGFKFTGIICRHQKVSLVVEDNVMNCNCKWFEFTSIICRNPLHVLFK